MRQERPETCEARRGQPKETRRGGPVVPAGTGLDLCPGSLAIRHRAVVFRPSAWAVAARQEDFGRSWSARVSEVPGIVEKQWKSPVWENHVTRCFSCGTCNLVCPTCYCFEVMDDVNLDVHSGNRTRTWDGCMLPHFAEVAGGHNFRPNPAERQRHRVKRKFEYLTKKYQHGAVCVGCGRCGRQCTSHIDIFNIIDDLVKEEGAG